MRTIAADGRFWQAVFLHSGNTLILLSKKFGISLLHFPSLELRARLLPAERNFGQSLPTPVPLESIAVSPDGTFLFAGTGGRRAYVWHLPSEALAAELQLSCPLANSSAGAPAVQAFPDAAGVEGCEVAALGQDGIVRVLRLPDGQVVAQAGAGVAAFALHANRLAAATVDCRLVLYDLALVRSRGPRRPLSEPQAARSGAERLGIGTGALGDKVSQGEAEASSGAAPSVGPRAAADDRIVRAPGPALSVQIVRAPSRPDGPSGSAAGAAGAALEAEPAAVWAERTERLRALLSTHGAFPEELREGIWRHLLRLPCGGAAAHRALAGGAEHAACGALLAQYRIPDSRQRARLRRCVHCVARWCEPLALLGSGGGGGGGFLPAYVWPWVQFFGRDERAAVEAVVSFSVNWAAAWFEYWPAPPLQARAKTHRACSTRGLKQPSPSIHLDELRIN